MTCPICRDGTLVPAAVETTMSHEGVTVVARDVPAEVCDSCGEHYFDAEVTQRLLDMAREA